MKTITHIACLLVGLAGGFVPGSWHGQLITLQASTPAAVDPTYANALSDDAVYRSRAPMAVGKR